MRKSRVVAPALVLPILLLAASCGSKSDSTNSASAADVAQCIAKAEALRDAKRAPAELKIPGPLDMSANEGKTVWIINAARVPFLQRISDGAEAAAKAAGMKTKVLYGDGSTASAQSAVEQAIAQKADGIVLVVVDPKTIERAVAKAHSAGIVVTDMINRSKGQSLPDGLAGDLAVDVPGDVGATVGWVLADARCEANMLMYSPSSLPITVDAAEETERVFKELCPWCEIEVKDLDYGNFASTLTGEVQTDIRRNPDLTHIYAVVGSSVPNVDAGLRAAAGDVKIVAHDGLDFNLDALREGSGRLALDISFSPNEAIGWQAIDQQGRLMSGDESAKEVVIPSRLLDESNVGKSEADAWPAFDSFESEYESAWSK
jgi:ribose transport system substrate-binding protein